jgi:hypothetical protein
MKIKYLILLLLLIGSTTFAANNTFSKTVLSFDKSKIWNIKITEKFETINNHKRCIKINTTYIDTLKTFNITIEAQKYINDSLSTIFSKVKYIHLSDSLVPRWTHMLGKETYIGKRLEIVDNTIYYYLTKPSFKPAVAGLSPILKALFISSIIFVFILYFLYSAIEVRNDIRKLMLIIFISFFAYFALSDSYNLITLIDCVLLSAIVFIPSFLATFIFFKKLEKSKIIDK